MDLGNKERILYLAKRRLIKCGICKPHRRENATRRRPKTNRYKNHRN